jgi:hypothetical protein
MPVYPFYQLVVEFAVEHLHAVAGSARQEYSFSV